MWQLLKENEDKKDGEHFIFTIRLDLTKPNVISSL